MSIIFTRRDFRSRIKILESTPGPEEPRQKVWRRDSAYLINNYKQIVVGYDLYANHGTINFNDVDMAETWRAVDGGNTPGPGAKVFHQFSPIELPMPHNITASQIILSRPDLVYAVKYSTFKSYCTDPHVYALFIQPGVAVTQYQDLGTVTVQLTVVEGETIQSDPLQIAAAETYSAIPIAPSNLNGQVLYSPRRVQLTWIDGGGETTYEIQRYTNGVWGALVSVPANQTTYTDTTVTPGTYMYRIRGCNASGSSSYVSSNVCGVS